MRVASASLRGARVIVAGAGLAGLTAARVLARDGADVRVLEARARVGGRVWTLRDAVDGVHVEAGGEFIDTEHAAIRELAGEVGLRLRPVLRRGFGSVLRIGDRLVRHRTQARPWAQLRRVLRPEVDAFTAAGRDPSSAVAAAIAGASLAERLRERHAPLAVMALAEALRGFYVADPEALSALVVVAQVAEAGTPGRESMARIDGGNDRLPAALIAALPAGAVSLSTQVRAVVSDADGVRVTADGPRGRIVLSADYVVLAVPAPILRTVAVDPPLPAATQRTLAGVSNGPATKAFVRYTRPWWRRAGWPRAFGTNLPCGAVWESAEEQRRAPVLTCLGGGAASESLQRVIPSVRRRAAALAWLGPASDPGRLLAEPVVWERDPFALGGYAVIGPQVDPRALPALRHSHGRIVFAGEHTSARWQGFMNGAVESGSDAAREIVLLERLRRSR
jgi:monoamine oxidase